MSDDEEAECSGPAEGSCAGGSRPEEGTHEVLAISSGSEEVASVCSGDSSSRESVVSRRVVQRRGGGRGGGVAASHGRARKKKASRRSGFRLCCKQFALTYPQCPVERAVFDPAFDLKFHPFEFASAREQHQDGSFHLHVYVAFPKRVDVQSSRYFDLAFAGQTYHPNVQKCKSREAWLEYIGKGDDHGADAVSRRPADLSGDLGYDPLSAPLGKRKSRWLDHLWSRQFEVQRALKPVQFPVELRTTERTYVMEAPNPGVKKRNWWIVAPPNAGKTRWLNRTFAGRSIYSPRPGPYPFEGYRDQDIVVYDDREGVKFEEFADVLNTWDIVHPVAGQVRYTTQDWKLGHTRNIIVLSNKTIEEVMPAEDVLRMKKRFMQIVNPILLLDGEQSDEEEEKEADAAAPAHVASSEFADFAS